MREKLKAIGTVEVGDWVQFNWGPWRQVEEVKERTRYWTVVRFAKLPDYPIEGSCAPDVEFPWRPA